MASQPADLHRLQYEKASIVRGHHIYKSLWTPEVNEILLLRRETGKEHDEYAVAVLQQLLRLTILFAAVFTAVSLKEFLGISLSHVACSTCNCHTLFPKPHPRPLLNCT